MGTEYQVSTLHPGKAVLKEPNYSTLLQGYIKYLEDLLAKK